MAKPLFEQVIKAFRTWHNGNCVPCEYRNQCIVMAKIEEYLFEHKAILYEAFTLIETGVCQIKPEMEKESKTKGGLILPPNVKEKDIDKN